ELERFDESIAWFRVALKLAETDPAATDAHRAALYVNQATVRNLRGDQLLKEAISVYDKDRDQHRHDSRQRALQADASYRAALRDLDRSAAFASQAILRRAEYQRAKALLGRGAVASLDHDYPRSVD